MKYSIKKIALLFLAAGLISLAACKKEVGSKKDFSPGFSLDKFEENLKASIMPAGAIGWTYIIAQDGKFARGGGFGKSRNKVDGDQSMSINRKINIASITKFLTAIAVMQLLEKKGLTIDSKILPYLPFGWDKGPGVSQLTFGDLLGHTSGLSSANAQFQKTLGYDGLRKMIDTGVIFPKTYLYRNANFALFRILITSMWDGMNGAPAINSLDSATTAQVYQQYMQDNVFSPIGLNNITCLPDNRSIETKYYNTADGDLVSGTNYSDWSDIAGGGGYFMTTAELAQVVAYFEHTNLLVSKNARDIMKANRLGFERSDNSFEIHGSYFGKGGSISTASVGGQGTLEQIIIFPNGVEATVMFNTQGMVYAGNQPSLSRAIFDAYNNAWE